MVFICAPLSRRVIQLSPLILTLPTFSISCHCWKGSVFKKRVCAHCSLPWALPLGALLVWSLLSEGPGLPFSVPSPPCGLNRNFFSMLLPMGSHRWNGPSCYIDSSISLLFGFLSWLSPDDHELLHDSFDTVRVLTIHHFILLGTLLLQMHQAYSRHFNCRLGPLKLLKGEETSPFGFGYIIGCLAPGWFHGVLFFSFPSGLQVVRVCLLLLAGLQVGHHGLEPFG